MLLEKAFEALLEEAEHFDSTVWLIIAAAAAFYYLIMIIAQYKLFMKAGEKGWKSLIPVYELFVSHHLIGMSHIWFILDTALWIAEIVMLIIGSVPLWIETTVAYVATVFALVAEIIHIHKLCNCYRKKIAFRIGMFLIPPLFSMILAFGKAEYHKPDTAH